MYCTNCGKETDETLRNCAHCAFDLIHVQALLAKDELYEEEIEEEFRTATECAKRCIALYCVVAAAHGEDRERIARWLKEQELWASVSPNEQEFLTAESPSKSQLINAGWRAEALYLLLWSLGKVKRADNLSSFCNIEEVQFIFGFYLNSAKEFVDSACFINEEYVYILNEEIYQAHWKIRDSQFRNKPIPDHLNPGVTQERHHAINWLMGYCGQDWDGVTTDT